MERRSFMAGAASIPLSLAALFGYKQTVDAEEVISLADGTIVPFTEELPAPKPEEPEQEYKLPIDFGNGYTGVAEGMYVDKQNKAKKVRGTFENGMLVKVDFHEVPSSIKEIV